MFQNCPSKVENLGMLESIPWTSRMKPHTYTYFKITQLNYWLKFILEFLKNDQHLLKSMKNLMNLLDTVSIQQHVLCLDEIKKKP